METGNGPAVEMATVEETAKMAVTMTENIDLGSAELVEQLGTAALAAASDVIAEAAAEQTPAAASGSKEIMARRFTVVTDPSRDALLTDFGKETLDDRYLLPGESYQDLFARVADAYADDADHAQRLYD